MKKNLFDILEEDLNGNNDSKKDRLNFTKFAVGDTYITILDVGTPRWTHFFKEAGNLTINCPGNNCPVCSIIRAAKKADMKTDYKSTKKYGMLVYNHNSGELEILDQKITFVKNLKGMMDDMREAAAEKIMEDNEELSLEEALEQVDPEITNLSKFVIRVRREGTGFNDTKYAFKKAPKKEQKDVPQAILDSLSEYELDELFLKLDGDQIKLLISGKTLKEIFNPDEDEEEVSVDFSK